MGLFSKLFGMFKSNPDLLPLLEAEIVGDEDFRFSVSFKKLHPDVRPVEFIRLVLHVYAKVLFNAKDDKSMPVQEGLRAMMALVASGIEAPDLFAVADIADVAGPGSLEAIRKNSPRRFAATLYFVSQTLRHVKTELQIGSYVQHWLFGVVALTAAVRAQLTPEETKLLGRALSIMNDAYDAGESPSTLEGLAQVPNGAFIEAVST